MREVPLLLKLSLGEYFKQFVIAYTNGGDTADYIDDIKFILDRYYTIGEQMYKVLAANINVLDTLYFELVEGKLPLAVFYLNATQTEELLFIAVKNRLDEKEVEYLALDLELKGRHVVHRAIEELDDSEDMKYFLQNAHLDVNKTNGSLSPLFFAIRSQKPGVVRLLLESGANIAIRHNGLLGPVCFAQSIDNGDVKQEIVGILQKELLAARVRSITM